MAPLGNPLERPPWETFWSVRERLYVWLEAAALNHGLARARAAALEQQVRSPLKIC